MQIDLTGKRALVTGSSGGIGQAIAAGLAASGALVFINGRSHEGVARAIEQISREVPDAQLAAAVGDVTDAAESVVAQAGAVDILVNNVGIYRPREAREITDAEWREMFETNVFTGARLSRLLVDGMLERGWGRIVFIASDAAIAIPADMVHYGASKTAMLALSRGLAKSVRGTGVTVNSVIAGPTVTEGVRAFIAEKIDPALSWEEAQAEFMRSERAPSLIGRLIEPAEIANMVVYLSSPQASATTGGAIRVDGGYVDAVTT
ncbi:SDR family NAD(P)-dependent oxidoreductase [Ornithinimicrobium pratense]|uniref:SDR family oxidoreductase n=1 Tax=Ornithinimicrobium pratense TaxID=2593973 RepID=A0A5J6V6U4_9MICO|nr:SDR family oxidoreductase [Ornithinimicrobium pratense]QFG69740.1 SDR family oxidoreductase [Ornithinimicrobium pratense]